MKHKGYLQPLPKTCKESSRISSYQIIMIHNVYGKLPEQIVIRKICTYLEAGGILPDKIGRYKPDKKTWNNAEHFLMIYKKIQK